MKSSLVLTSLLAAVATAQQAGGNEPRAAANAGLLQGLEAQIEKIMHSLQNSTAGRHRHHIATNSIPGRFRGRPSNTTAAKPSSSAVPVANFKFTNITAPVVNVTIAANASVSSNSSASLGRRKDGGANPDKPNFTMPPVRPGRHGSHHHHSFSGSVPAASDAAQLAKRAHDDKPRGGRGGHDPTPTGPPPSGFPTGPAPTGLPRGRGGRGGRPNSIRPSTTPVMERRAGGGRGGDGPAPTGPPPSGFPTGPAPTGPPPAGGRPGGHPNGPAPSGSARPSGPAPSGGPQRGPGGRGGPN